MLETCQLFNIKTFREYHDLYLKRDVYGLCDMFEAFRDVCSNSYGLDPCHYMGNPSLSWDAMLKHTCCTGVAPLSLLRRLAAHAAHVGPLRRGEDVRLLDERCAT